MDRSPIYLVLCQRYLSFENISWDDYGGSHPLSKMRGLVIVLEYFVYIVKTLCKNKLSIRITSL